MLISQTKYGHFTRSLISCKYHGSKSEISHRDIKIDIAIYYHVQYITHPYITHGMPCQMLNTLYPSLV